MEDDELWGNQLGGCLLVKRQDDAPRKLARSVDRDFLLPVTTRKVWLGCFASRLHCG